MFSIIIRSKGSAETKTTNESTYAIIITFKKRQNAIILNSIFNRDYENDWRTKCQHKAICPKIGRTFLYYCTSFSNEVEI
jgi:hypothetical protein